MLSEDQAQRVMRDLFAPSTTRDVAREREWREQRALASRDHRRRHTAISECENSPANDAFAAHEILVFCCGADLPKDGER